MITKTTLVQTESQATAVIHFLIPREQIQEVVGPAIQEVMETVTAQGIGPAGPVFLLYLNLEVDIFDFEVGVPVSAPVRPAGRVYASELPAASAVRTIYTGPYEGLGEGWQEFMTVLKEEGWQTSPGLWERYLKGPESTPDSTTWQTELNRSVVV